MSESIHKAISAVPKVSEFNSVIEYKHWKNVVERIARIYKLTDDDIVDLVIIRTSGDISQKIGTRKITTVKELWDHMDEAHGDTHDTSRFENMYALIHPPTSVTTMAEYITHFEEYSNRLDNSFTEDADKTLLFMSPLNPVIAHGIITQDPKTFEETKKFATVGSLMLPHEIFRKGLSRVNTKPTEDNNTTTTPEVVTNTVIKDNQTSKPSQVQCHYCNELGHYANECKIKQENQYKPNNSGHYFNIRRKKNMDYKSRRSNPHNFIDIKDTQKSEDTTNPQSDAH